jgi:hypothetical protein
MAKMINYDGELIRIASANKLEHSKNDGRSWSTIFSGTSIGDIQDLTENGKEILATTSKGLYVSKNGGRSFSKRS